MDYRKFGDTLLVRLDRGEEIIEQVKALALKENITLASVQALGALGSFTVGVYNVDEKKYYANSFGLLRPKRRYVPNDTIGGCDGKHCCKETAGLPGGNHADADQR